MEILIPVLLLTGLAIFFAGILAWANVKFKVERDPRIDAILAVLPGANCGGCGFAGCAAFAEAVVTGKARVNGCPVGRQKVAEEISKIMGVTSEK